MTESSLIQPKVPLWSWTGFWGKGHFDQLEKYDKRRAYFVVWAEELASSLISVISYDRGPTRPLTIEEMKHGLPVLWNTEGFSSKPSGPPDAGRITDWATDEEGFLCSITVEWEDGTHSEHLPEERELRRCEGGGGGRA